MNILVFDDHNLFGESLKQLLLEKKQVKSCLYTNNEIEFYNYLEKIEFDIILLDINLRDNSSKSGLEILKDIVMRYKNIKVVILSSYDLPIYKKIAMENGAYGFINKSTSIDCLIDELLYIMGNKKINFYNNINNNNELTNREIEILQELCTGKSKKEISEILFISERTLYNHLQNIYGKLGVKNSLEAFNKALSLGYLEPKI